MAVSFMLAAAQPAGAHAVYARSNPAADARLLRAPTEVRISFTESVDPRFSEIQVLDTGGKRFDTGALRAGDDAESLVVAVSPIVDGGYTVSWRVLSTVDGHETRGSFAFSVGDAPLPQLVSPDSGGTRTPGPLELLGRWLGFAGTALVLGSGIFALMVTGPASASRPAAARLVTLGGLALIGSAVALFADQLASQARGDLGGALGGLAISRQGGLLALRIVAGAVALIAVRQRSLAPRIRCGLLVGAGLAAALALTLVSHAAAAGQPVGIVIDLLHIAAVSAWAGGLPFLIVGVLGRSSVPDGARGALVWRFSLLSIGSVALIVLTGAFAAISRLSIVWDLIETSYGIALLAKVVLLLLAMVLGARNLLLHGPRLRSAERGARAAIRKGARIEIGLVALILVATAVLTASVTPAQPALAGLRQVARVEGMRIELGLASATPGRNRYEVRVSEGLRPVEAIEKVLLRFHMLTMDMGQTELVATQRGPGLFVAEGSPTSMYGPWQVEVIVRPLGQADRRTLFTVEVMAAAGAAGGARVIRAEPYNLIVFTDPQEAVGGAPFALNIVVTEPSGQPILDAKVAGRLVGVEGLEVTATAAGGGRYVIDVRGLPAGSYGALLEITRAGVTTPVNFSLVVAK